MSLQKDFTTLPTGDRLIIDWLSVTSKVHNLESMIKLTGIDKSNFEVLPGMHGFQYRMFFNGVSIHYNNPGAECLTAGFVWLDMSGQGCRCFETYGNGDYEKIFNLCRQEAGKETKQRNFRITRLDVAFDDMSGVFDINTIFDHTRYEWFVSRMSKHNYYGGSDGLSSTFGSKQSNVFIRFYDKAAERGFTPAEVPHWVRCEIMLKSENALGFLMKLDDLGFRKLFLCTLKNYISFRVPNEGDSNKRRWDEPEWWSTFLDGAVAVSIWDKPGVPYNLSVCERYVTTQPIGSIKTLIKIHGEEAFLSMVRNCPMPKNPKYRRLIAEANCLSDDEVLEVLSFENEAAFISEVKQAFQDLHELRATWEKDPTNKNKFDAFQDKANYINRLKKEAEFEIDEKSPGD